MNGPTDMEPTELAPPETETCSIHAWALDHHDPDDPPTQRPTSRRITALGVAASLIVIASAGVLAVVVNRQHSQPKAPSAPVVATVAAPPPTVTMTLPPQVTVTAAAPSTVAVPSCPPSVTNAPTGRSSPPTRYRGRRCCATATQRCSVRRTHDMVLGRERRCGTGSGGGGLTP